MPCAALEQNFGKTAGGCTDVEADPSRNIEGKTVERRRELGAAARHVRVRGLGRNRAASEHAPLAVAEGSAFGPGPPARAGGWRAPRSFEPPAGDQEPTGPFPLPHGDSTLFVRAREAHLSRSA